VAHVWSPVFTKAMFGMANMLSALFRVSFLQFSREERESDVSRIWMALGRPELVLLPKWSVMLLPRSFALPALRWTGKAVLNRSLQYLYSATYTWLCIF
jgi:hypothetical protein